MSDTIDNHRDPADDLANELAHQTKKAARDQHSEQDNDLLDQQIDATIRFEGTRREVDANDSAALTKQNRDLAFAAALVGAGTISTRRLAESTADWTTHGHETLADHLVARGIIPADRKAGLEKDAERRLSHILAELTQPANRDNSRGRDSLLITRLDSSGKLAKLLGLADASVLTVDQMEGRQVGARYTLLRRLGQGGIGTVWLARDENLRRYVAVKEVTRQIEGDDLALAHFRREAEITGKLEHPGIVPVYQYGIDEESGRSFYVMRFLGKRTLQDAITEYHERRVAGNLDQMEFHRLLTAFVNICQAVEHAHRRKIIHRDLKPENIAIDSFGQIVLLDWGLAKINDETGMYDVNGQSEPGDLHSIGSTHAGRVLGTPLYMAPEQAAGRLDEVDEKTDVYGLGGILYSILTGEAPHQRTIESPEGTRKTSEIFSRIVAAEAIPPNRILDDVPDELSAVCAKALANKRYLRYSSARELAEEIERYRAGTPVAAYRAPLKLRAKKWMVNHPTLTQLMLLMTALTILGAIAIGLTARSGREALTEARFESLIDFTRDLELNLRFETRELVQDARFITDFPLMRAITASCRPSTVKDGIIQRGTNSIDIAEVSPEEWIERQGTLLDGLLEANPAYLVATTVHFETPNMTELVRTERLAAGLRPRRVPKQQLFSGAHPNKDAEFFALRRGEVILTTGDQLDENVPTKNRSALTLIAVCPVFDETGEFFGINALEHDLRGRLEELFLAINHDGMEVFITNSTGQIALIHREGESVIQSGKQSVVSEFPQLKNLFTDLEAGTEFGDQKSLYAIRVPLGDSRSQAYFGIVTRLISTD